MRRIFFFLLLLPSAFVFGEQTGEIIGYIDMQYVFENSNLKDTAYKEYLNKKKRLIEEKENVQKRVRQMEESLEQKKQFLGYSEYIKEKEASQEALDDYREQVKKFQDEMVAWETDTMAGVFDEIINVMEIIAKEEKMPVIVSRKSVVYGKYSRDMSQKAIDIINEVNQRSVPTAK